VVPNGLRAIAERETPVFLPFDWERETPVFFIEAKGVSRSAMAGRSFGITAKRS